MIIFANVILTVVSYIFLIGISIILFLWVVGLIYNFLSNIYDVFRASWEGIINDEE